MWQAMCTIPIDGTPVFVLYKDGSGVFTVVFRQCRGRAAFWDVELDAGETDTTRPYAYADDLGFAAGWMPIPDIFMPRWVAAVIRDFVDTENEITDEASD
jgi:hypothetical protein